MKTNDENLKKVRSLLRELDELEDAFDVLKNYDAKACYCFSTGHNNNTKITKTVFVTMSPEILKQVKEELTLRIENIKKELKKV